MEMETEMGMESSRTSHKFRSWHSNHPPKQREPQQLYQENKRIDMYFIRSSLNFIVPYKLFFLFFEFDSPSLPGKQRRKYVPNENGGAVLAKLFATTTRKEIFPFYVDRWTRNIG